MIVEVLEVMTARAKEGMTMRVVCHEMGFAKPVVEPVVFHEAPACRERGCPQ